MDIYTDCSYNDKLGIAGIGLYIKDGVKRKTISSWMPATDNNIGEIWAIYIASILLSGKKGTIYTDSATALAYIKNEVKEKPRTREQFERHQRMRLIAYKIRRLNPNVEKVKGHDHRFQEVAISNAIADLLAKEGIAKKISLTKGGR